MHWIISKTFHFKRHFRFSGRFSCSIKSTTSDRTWSEVAILSFYSNSPRFVRDLCLSLRCRSVLPQRSAHQGLKHLGWNASKTLLWTERVLKKKKGRIKARLESNEWAARDKMALCPSEPHFIFCSVTAGRKQSQVTDLMLITRGLPPFRKTKADGGHYTNSILSSPSGTSEDFIWRE